MKRYAYTDELSNVIVAPSKIIKNPMILCPILVDPGSKKIRSPNYSARYPLTGHLSGLGFAELQNGHLFNAGRDRKSSLEGPNKSYAF